MTKDHRPPLYFSSQSKSDGHLTRGIRPAELSHIFSYLANKAIAGCTIMKKHFPPMNPSMCGYHVQISGYFVQCAVTMSKYPGILYIVLYIPVFFLSWLLASLLNKINTSKLIDAL
jgi:hypothetical protein